MVPLMDFHSRDRSGKIGIRGQVFTHRAFTPNLSEFTHMQMPSNAHLTAKNHITASGCRAAQAHLRDNDAVFA